MTSPPQEAEVIEMVKLRDAGGHPTVACPCLFTPASLAHVLHALTDAQAQLQAAHGGKTRPKHPWTLGAELNL